MSAPRDFQRRLVMELIAPALVHILPDQAMEGILHLLPQRDLSHRAEFEGQRVLHVRLIVDQAEMQGQVAGIGTLFRIGRIGSRVFRREDLLEDAQVDAIAARPP